ncbi:hypothetical protein PLESTF_000491100 [Pleodorina starrii]|nr:hypothetical protein PLESTM_000560700 [Pleodorina starrii]GLC66926.1 hypothetical protein PLESTF_000491100 [Pleodorina starrii]
MASSTLTRRRPKVPIGLQIRHHGAGGEPYWAVVAVQSMPSASVSVLQPYDSSWQRRPKDKSCVAVTFVDELSDKPSSPDLEGRTVYVTREWLESCFLEPTWEEFECSEVRVLGASVGIMTGLLPPVPSAANKRGGHILAGAFGASTLYRALPLLLLNVGLAVLLWLAVRYVDFVVSSPPAPVSPSADRPWRAAARGAV